VSPSAVDRLDSLGVDDAATSGERKRWIKAFGAALANGASLSEGTVGQSNPRKCYGLFINIDFSAVAERYNGKITGSGVRNPLYYEVGRRALLGKSGSRRGRLEDSQRASLRNLVTRSNGNSSRKLVLEGVNGIPFFGDALAEVVRQSMPFR